MNYKETKGLEGSSSSKSSLSTEQKRQVYFGQKKLQELISKCKNKQEGEVVVGKFSKILKEKVAPIVASAILAVSPLLLAGCDEDTNVGSKNTTENVSYEVVTDENGSEYTRVVEEVTEPEPEIVTLPEKERGVLESTIGSFNFEDAINQKYSKKASALIEEALKDQVMKPDGTGSMEKRAIAVAMDNLRGGDDEFLINLNVLLEGYPKDCSVQYYRNEDASVFIITTPSGTLYNGVINGDVYTDGSEYLGPFGLTEETGALLRQMSVRADLDKLHGDEIMSFVFFPDGYSSGVQGPDDKLSFCEMAYKKTIYKEAETSPFGDVITEGHYVNVDSDSAAMFYYSGDAGRGARIESVDFNIYVRDENGDYVISENGKLVPTTYATASFDYEPENIILPDAKVEQLENQQ